jgi:5-deoxy-glucuronate isomerase
VPEPTSGLPEPTIHARSLPDDRPADALLLRPSAEGTIRLHPARAGWRYLSFETIGLGAGKPLELGDPRREEAVVILGGGGLSISFDDGRTVQLPGRASPFEGLPWALYLPPGRTVQAMAEPVSAGGTVQLAVADAPVGGGSTIASDPVVIGADDVTVEVRGAGNATRQINHIIDPSFPADRLEVVEVLTPSGNWSSWPPHKHDVDDMPAEAVLEEVYHSRFRRPQAWAIQRVYRADRSRDGIWEVRDGDVVIVPDGYHPFSAAHGDDAYYLNALAGDRRTMACSFDPDLDWVRGTWDTMEPDPRVPLVGAVKVVTPAAG